MYDLIIVGGGPAAMSAAIYAARKKIKTLILTNNFGGQMLEAYPIENYLGIPGLLGVDLAEKFKEHLMTFESKKSGQAFELETKEGEIVQNIRKSAEGTGGFEIFSNKGNYLAKAVIVATGKGERKLDIEGAKEFEGKGISYCATCDAPIFRDKIVAVIGGGDAGQDTAWELSKYASRVYLLNKYLELQGDDVDLRQKIEKEPKIEIFNEVMPKKILGDKFVSGLIFENSKTKESKNIEVNGIFVEIGSVPASVLVEGLLECNEKGEIIIDHKDCSTSTEGVFAAGDVTDVSEKQIIIAAGMGAKAALSAYEYLKNH